MIKYSDTQVVFSEVPDEITLAINISGCPIHCPDCHSKELWDNIGDDLSYKELNKLIELNKGITCVSFMGGDSDVEEISNLTLFVKTNYPELKVAWYSGRTNVENILPYLKHLDFIKIGPFIKERGGLDNPNTNQKFYKICGKNWEDITYKFYKNGQ